MRAAMAEAEVGDDQGFDDPTINALIERVSDLLGHEAAVFLPSGTMCNAIAFRVHIRPGGDQAILDRTAHPLTAEAAGPAALSGALLTPLDGDGGVFTPAQLQEALRPDDRYEPRSRLVSVEQTTNLGGGRVWPLETVDGVLAVARAHGLRAHLDGARLFNAVVASGVEPARWARGFDTAWIDFTKGLGAPLGAVLAGSRELIEEAWRYKQMLGGALRQAGICAAACIYALDHHVDRLEEDHDNACALAEGLAQLGVAIEPARVTTNIVIFEVENAPAFVHGLEEKGVRVGALDGRSVRAVTHLDVDRAGIERALHAARDVLRGS
ncbi:MAG TPA: threonine aldolase family protein [Actinomycetota bacterium]|nr:threonine aldolase family protein [Actinomycetota bacterium]